MGYASAYVKAAKKKRETEAALKKDVAVALKPEPAPELEHYFQEEGNRSPIFAEGERRITVTEERIIITYGEPADDGPGIPLTADRAENGRRLLDLLSKQSKP